MFITVPTVRNIDSTKGLNLSWHSSKLTHKKISRDGVRRKKCLYTTHGDILETCPRCSLYRPSTGACLPRLLTVLAKETFDMYHATRIVPKILPTAEMSSDEGFAFFQTRSRCSICPSHHVSRSTGESVQKLTLRATAAAAACSRTGSISPRPPRSRQKARSSSNSRGHRHVPA